MTEQLKALAEAATKGEWAVVDGHYPSFKELTGPSFSVSVVMFATDLTDADTDQREADLQYIAAANPERILALIAENERLAHSRKDAEPVAYQYRMKPEWHDAWVKWQPCDKANFDDYVKAPVVNGWQFDARALFTHPPEADKPNPLEDLDCAKMMVRSSGYSIVSADFIIAFAEFIQDWRNGDFDLPKLAALDVEACFDAWQAGVNQAEVKTTKNTEPNTNGTDYVLDAQFDALIAELQSITEEARATDYHDTLRKAVLFLNLLKSKARKYANDIVRLDAACTEQHAAYTSAHNRLNEADKLLQQALDALEDESLVKINNSITAIRTYLEGKK